jgi:hypothetical protein
MTCLVPKVLDLDSLIRLRPPKGVDRFKKDYLVYIIHLVTEIPGMDRSLEYEHGFVPIHAATVQRVVKNYNQYLTYLINAGVLISDGQYVPGRKSKGYQFAGAYRGAVRSVYLTDTKLIKKLKPKPLSATSQRRYRHLTKWFNIDLSIRYDLALNFLQQDLDRKVRNPALQDRELRTLKRKDPYTQYNHARVAIEKFSAAAFHISIDNKGFRLHSLLSNMRSDLRNCLTYNGLELVSIDICNSQPYILQLLLQMDFWDSYYNTP